MCIVLSWSFTFIFCYQIIIVIIRVIHCGTYIYVYLFSCTHSNWDTILSHRSFSNLHWYLLSRAKVGSSLIGLNLKESSVNNAKENTVVCSSIKDYNRGLPRGGPVSLVYDSGNPLFEGGSF